MSELLFSSAPDAIKWSQECCLMPDLGSQMSKWQKPSGSTMSRDEVRDIAQTISCIVSDIKPWIGDALKAVYAGHDALRDCELGAEIGKRLQRLDCGKGKRAEQLYRLGFSVVKAERKKRLYGDRYWYKRMASDIGIHVDTFRKDGNWIELLALAQETLNQWLDNGERRVETELNELGWMA